jgi:murein DD-endopeptidase MepM/ murein hydrolase activator NlpD
MKKFYYFSEKSLNFLEIKHFKEKAAAIFTISVLLLSSILFGLFYLISNLSDRDKDLKALKEENQALKSKFSELSDQYLKLENELVSLNDLSNQLRLATNLSPINPEERELGIGGSSSIEKLYTEFGSDISDIINITETVTKRFEFEKSQFNQITGKIKQNKLLFESIPAIIPTTGNYSVESFGMRMHPILGINKMHNGIDIINDIGTIVKSTGKGKVVFVGQKGGYGLAVEIDHGFGYKTVYAHLSTALVKEGQSVLRGQSIAKSGNSGLSSGPHLHYEVLHNGQNLNPADFFFDEYSYFESN